MGYRTFAEFRWQEQECELCDFKPPRKGINVEQVRLGLEGKLLWACPICIDRELRNMEKNNGKLVGENLTKSKDRLYGSEKFWGE